jgi:hypothetical protein
MYTIRSLTSHARDLRDEMRQDGGTPTVGRIVDAIREAARDARSVPPHIADMTTAAFAVVYGDAEATR